MRPDRFIEHQLDSLPRSPLLISLPPVRFPDEIYLLPASRAPTPETFMSAVEAALRVLGQRQQLMAQQITQQQEQIRELLSRPRTITEEIDQIPGRRIDTVLTGEITFTLDDEGRRGNPILVQVSQDGPFVMTHYPMAIWRPTAPTNATYYQQWSPVSHWPIPAQEYPGNIIDIMYELQDGGNQRNFQNAPRGPLLSRPDNIVPAAVPTLWAPNSALVFVPTYNLIDFAAGQGTATTQGTLHVDFIGYRIVNL